MRLALSLSSLLLCAVVATPSAFAGDVVTPDGFNLETRPTGGQPVLRLDDGATLMKFGGFGPNLFRVLHADGTLTLFATGVGSFAGAARSPVTGDVFIGDFNTGGLWQFHDANADGDMLDGGERFMHPASLAVLGGGGTVSPYALDFRPGTDELYMNGTGSDFLGYVVRITDASTPAAAANLYADGLTVPGGLVFDGDVLFAADFSFNHDSRVLRLADGNADGDALDVGEAGDYATGLLGANLLARDAAGNLYLSGVSDFFSLSAIAFIGADADRDGVADEVIESWVTGVGFTGSMLALEGPGGLVGGVDGDGLLWIEDADVPGGSRLLRTAPLAGTSVVGHVANNSVFDVVVSGTPGALALVALSLDTVGFTVVGVGDLGFGISAPHLITAPLPVDTSGQAVATFSFHGLDALVGLDLVIQGVTLEAGAVGIGNSLDTTVGA